MNYQLKFISKHLLTMNFQNFCEKKSIPLKHYEVKEIHNVYQQYFYYQKNDVVELDDIQNITSNYLLGFDVKNSIKCKLFLVKINNINYSVFLINNHMFHVKFRFHEDLFNGTLFEGELIKNDKKCWVFYMSDIIYMSGSYIYNKPFKHRLNTIAFVLKDLYTYDLYFNVCHLQLKSYFLFNHMYFLEEDCELLFIPEYSNMNFYKKKIIFPKTEKSLLKDGEIKEFTLKKTEKVERYDLYNERNEYDSFACVNSLKLSLFLKELFKNKDSYVMKCKYSTFFKSWVPVI